MRPETDPPQTDEIAQAIAELLERAGSGPDPWWQAGIDESLEE